MLGSVDFSVEKSHKAFLLISDTCSVHSLYSIFDSLVTVICTVRLSSLKVQIGLFSCDKRQTTLPLVHVRRVSIGYTMKWRSLCDLHHRGPEARGGVRSIETEPSCVTDLYNAYMGLVQILVGV